MGAPYARGGGEGGVGGRGAEKVALQDQLPAAEGSQEGQRSDGEDAAARRCQRMAEEFLWEDGGRGCTGCEQAEFARGGPQGFSLLGEPASRGWGLNGACVAVIERLSAWRRRAVLWNFGSVSMYRRIARSHWRDLPLLCIWPVCDSCRSVPVRRRHVGGDGAV